MLRVKICDLSALEDLAIDSTYLVTSLSNGLDSGKIVITSKTPEKYSRVSGVKTTARIISLFSGDFIKNRGSEVSVPWLGLV
jgi:hypothetical protein